VRRMYIFFFSPQRRPAARQFDCRGDYPRNSRMNQSLRRRHRVPHRRRQSSHSTRTFQKILIFGFMREYRRDCASSRWKSVALQISHAPPRYSPAVPPSTRLTEGQEATREVASKNPGLALTAPLPPLHPHVAFVDWSGMPAPPGTVSKTIDTVLGLWIPNGRVRPSAPLTPVYSWGKGEHVRLGSERPISRDR
jgi:hypothetical protein